MIHWSCSQSQFYRTMFSSVLWTMFDLSEENKLVLISGVLAGWMGDPRSEHSCILQMKRRKRRGKDQVCHMLHWRRTAERRRNSPLCEKSLWEEKIPEGLTSTFSLTLSIQKHALHPEAEPTPTLYPAQRSQDVNGPITMLHLHVHWPNFTFIIRKSESADSPDLTSKAEFEWQKEHRILWSCTPTLSTEEKKEGKKRKWKRWKGEERSETPRLDDWHTQSCTDACSLRNNQLAFPPTRDCSQISWRILEPFSALVT